MTCQKESDQKEPKGLICPRCGCRHFRVVYTRPKRNGKILRRRECRHCGRRIITWEYQIGSSSDPSASRN